MFLNERVKAREHIVLALDVRDRKTACEILDEVRGFVGTVKIGLEFVTAVGLKDAVTIARRAGAKVFADLKFHDIPNTVAGAVYAACEARVDMLNIHCTGGPAMMKAAVEARDRSTRKPLLFGVTILTSLDIDQMAQTGLMEPLTPEELEKHPDAESRRMNKLIRSLAGLGKECGLDGVICSPLEIKATRAICGKSFKIMTPGIRPLWAQANDQKRVKTPGEAVRDGADYIVIGRPITKPPALIDGRVKAAKLILDEVTEAAFPSP